MGQHLSGVAHQVVEQVVLGGGQWHRFAAPRHLTAGKVHAQVAADEGFFVGQGERLGAAEHRPHSRQQL